MSELQGRLVSEQDTAELAGRLASALAVQAAPQCCVLALQGELGAGKSFFARALLRSQSVTGAVKSPTYTLIEPYQSDLGLVLHLDLYRLADPEEMEFLGLAEQMAEARLVMVEWPSRAAGYLPPIDLSLTLSVEAEYREWALAAKTEFGEACLQSF